MAARAYELTQSGAELKPVFAALASCGMRSPVVTLEGDLSEDSVMLHLRTCFMADDPHWNATYEISRPPSTRVGWATTQAAQRLLDAVQDR